MAKKTMALGDLQDMLLKYRKALNDAKTKTTKKFLDDGTLQEVSSAKIAKAADSLKQASDDVSEICQQAILAISVE